MSARIRIEGMTPEDEQCLERALIRSGMRRVCCTVCGAALQALTRDPSYPGPPEGWVCKECGGVIRRAPE